MKRETIYTKLFYNYLTESCDFYCALNMLCGNDKKELKKLSKKLTNYYFSTDFISLEPTDFLDKIEELLITDTTSTLEETIKYLSK